MPFRTLQPDTAIKGFRPLTPPADVSSAPDSAVEPSRINSMLSTMSAAPNETIQDFKQIGTGFQQSVNERFGNIQDIAQASSNGEQGHVRGFLQTAGQIAGVGADAIGSIAKGAVKVLLPQQGEDLLKSAAGAIVNPIAQSGSVKGLLDRYEQLKKDDPKAARDINAVLGVADLASNFLGLTGAKAGATVAKEGATLAADMALKNTPKLLSYTSEVPEAAFKLLKERIPQVETALKAGSTPETALNTVRQGVRNFRKTLSSEWDQGVNTIVKENTGVKFGLGDNLANKLLKISDEFGIEVPENLKGISASETIGLLKKINELPSAMLTFSPKGSLVREVKTALKDAAIKAFGGEKGSFSNLYSNYSSKKGVLDAANDIVNAYAEGRPIKDATAMSRLTKIFDENKPAYLNAILDLEKATGKDLLSEITATKFTKKLPTVSSLKGGLTEKALKLLILPLTSPRGVMWIQKNLQGASNSIKSFIDSPKLGASVSNISKNISSAEKGTIRDFTDFVNGAYKPTGKTLELLKRDAQEIADKYGFTSSLKGDKSLSNQFGQYLDSVNYDKKIFKNKPVIKKAEGYTMSHRPSEGVRAFNLTEKVNGEEMIPKDMYEKWHGSRGTTADKESISVLKAIKDKPEASVTIYRASPKPDFNDGDWVTLSKEYATQHATGNGTKVHSKVVKAKDLKWAMDDINEFGYYPEKSEKSKEYIKKRLISLLDKTKTK